MKTEDLERALRDAKFHHLVDDVLISYRDQKLDGISRRQAEAHLDLCLICERRLLLLQEELLALDDQDMHPEEAALVERVLNQMRIGQSSTSEPRGPGPSMKDRVNVYMQQASASWQACVLHIIPVREAAPGDEIWRWESEDGGFVAYAIMKSADNLAFHFSSTDPALEGAPLRIKAGSLSQETILRRISETDISAEIVISRDKHPNSFDDISFETD